LLERGFQVSVTKKITVSKKSVKIICKNSKNTYYLVGEEIRKITNRYRHIGDVKEKFQFGMHRILKMKRGDLQIVQRLAVACRHGDCTICMVVMVKLINILDKISEFIIICLHFHDIKVPWNQV